MYRSERKGGIGKEVGKEIVATESRCGGVGGGDTLCGVNGWVRVVCKQGFSKRRETKQERE